MVKGTPFVDVDLRDQHRNAAGVPANTGEGC